jgi:DNA-binding transcriptional regulator YhcF (GntR family)
MSEVTLKDVAWDYFRLGVRIVLAKTKKPMHDWAKWQTEEQSIEEFNALPWESADCFGVICGTQLNDKTFLAAVDYDIKNVSEEAKEKGKQTLKDLPITCMERTPSGGLHYVYFSKHKPKTISVFHNTGALELLGEGKLCFCWPSTGYQRLNDNYPTTVDDLEGLFYDALHKAGICIKEKTIETTGWFDGKDQEGKAYKGSNPPCIAFLCKGTKEGSRHEYGIRLAAFYLNFKKYQPNSVQKILKEWNKLNTPSLDQSDLDTLVKSAAQGAYVYGCSDPFLLQVCKREECHIPSKAIVLSDDQKRQATEILEKADLLGVVLEHGSKRLLGENDVLAINFLEICSGQTLYPISGIISGFSGSGKNESIRAIKPLIPSEWLFEFTTSTPEAIKYVPEEFAGTLIIYEASAMQSKTSTLGLRAVGEGESIETIYPMRDEATGKMSLGKAKTNAKNFITTESDIDIQPDLYRRVLKYSMNPSYALTMRVCGKVIRDSYTPESLRQLLHKDKEPSVSIEDFQNALRTQDWKVEVIVFTEPGLLKLVNAPITTEQQVALRTQFGKILNFIKVLALLNQQNRVRMTVKGKKYVIAGPQDYSIGLQVLSSTIMETISRIEKRQSEVLELFEKIDILTKDKVAKEIKVSPVTAARALKTLARTGYLKENDSIKPYTYEKVKDKPNPLVIVQNTSQYRQFYETELETYLDGTLSLILSEGGKSADLNIERPCSPARIGVGDKTSDKMASEPNSEASEQTSQKQLVFSEMTSEKRLNKNE